MYLGQPQVDIYLVGEAATWETTHVPTFSPAVPSSIPHTRHQCVLMICIYTEYCTYWEEKDVEMKSH